MLKTVIKSRSFLLSSFVPSKNNPEQVHSLRVHLTNPFSSKLSQSTFTDLLKQRATSNGTINGYVSSTKQKVIEWKLFDGLIEKYKFSRRCLDDKDPTFVFVAKSY